MAQDPKKAREFADATRVAAEAVEDTNQLVKNLGGLLEKRIAQAKKFNLAMGNTVDAIGAIKSDTQNLGGVLGKLVKLKIQEKKTENDIASAFKKKGGFAQGYNQHILAALKTNKTALSAEKEAVLTAMKKDNILTNLVDKAKSFAKAITVGSIFASLIAVAKKFGETLDTIGQQFGSLNVLGEGVTDNLLDSQIEAIRLGGSIQDVASITNTLASNFGMSLEEASKLSGKVFDTSKAIGLSADEGANLFGALTQVANLSAEQAESLAEGAFQLARQRGVAPSAVLRDIAGSAEEIALFTKGGGDNIAEAAVQARSLGLSLSQTTKIAEGLLDFENSITKEVEASLLIGRQLNLQKAREAALSGDIAGAMEEVVKQVGSEQDFLNLNLIQRKALADSIGVSVNEMAKLVGQSDKLSLSGAMAAGNFGDLLGEEGISNISAIVGQFKALTANLVNELGPTLEKVVGQFSDFVNKGGGVEAIGGAIKLVATGISTIINNLPTLIGGFVALKGIQSGLALASIFPALAKSATFGGAVGVAATVAAIAAGMVTLKAMAVDDFTSGPGGITTMMGPAGVFSLNPRDSVLATTNPIPVNDFMTGPPGSMGGNSNVSVSVGGKISGRDIVFFQEQGAEFGDAPGNGLM